MGITIEGVGEERASEYLDALGMAFGFDSLQEEQVADFVSTCEWDRARVALDSDKIVGTAGAFSLDMTVPGGTMACGGTTLVSVLPTHRRQGILRSMIDSHLADVRDRSEPIAALWASDSAIYGRFGYGRASNSVTVEVSRDHNGFHRLAPAPAPVRFVTADEAKGLLPPFYDRVRTNHPGLIARSENWWERRRFRDRPDGRGGAGAYRYAVTEEAGRVTGFVQYRFKEEWSDVDGHGSGEVRIRELIADNPSGWAGLWSFALNHDLTAKLIAPLRSTSDPLFELLAGPRRAVSKISDGLWVRIMDVKAALEGRSYAGTADVVVEVHDPLDATTSTWRLELTPDGAEVTRSQAAADVTMDIEDLGSCFLGDARFWDQRAAGRVGGSPQHLAALDRAFGWTPAPWGAEIF